MSDSQLPLQQADIRHHLQEVADELRGPGSQHVLVVVGGALLAWHGLRLSTYDIDTVTALDEELSGAVARVAGRYGRRVDWLNDNARGFTPATFEVSKCDLLFESDRLRVLGAPLDQIFVMKLYRSDAQDVEDMVRIWSLCSFESAQMAVECFESAYPQAPQDPHLIDFVQTIADRSAGRTAR